MNTEVNYEIAKLLAEKGFPQNNIDYGTISSIGKNDNNDLIFGETYACPNISQVVMWLYEKHGIWIDVTLNQFSKPNDLKWMYSIVFTEERTYSHSQKSFNSPTEAYLSGITHTLKDLM